MTHTHALEAYRAAYQNANIVPSAGLGFSYNSRDMGPLVPPPTPRPASSETLTDAHMSQSALSTVEEQVLNSMLTNKLYMRRRTTRKPLAAIITKSSPRSPLGIHPSSHPTAVPPSPTMATFPAFGLASPTAVEANEFDIERVGRGISGLSLSFPLTENDDEDAEMIFEDDEWEYIKPAGFKSCKGRVCTPRLTLGRNDSWL